MTTTLAGRYVRIGDTCGAISASRPPATSPWAAPTASTTARRPGSAARATPPSSRSAFYEVNKIDEMARGWLPTNTWLNAQLTANVNINQTCNGFWNGSTINFYRSGGGCRNTGELAGVFDHEWGHGMDDNDANGTISNSGEGYADIAAIYRYQDSCVGHGFFMPPAASCGLTAGRHRRQHGRGPDGRRALRHRLLGRARRRLGQALGQHPRHRRSATSAAAA